MYVHMPSSPRSIAGVLRPGASGLPYFCTPPVTVPQADVLGVPAVRGKKKSKQKGIVALYRVCSTGLR